MNAPKRWLDESSNVSAHTRELMNAGLDAEPPAGASDAIWAALATKIGPLSGGGGSGGDPGAGAMTAKAAGSAKAVTASGGVLKSLFAGAIVASLGVAQNRG